MRRLRWVIPLALLVALALLAVAPFTATGTRLAVAAANTVPGLSVQHRSGTLLGDLELAALRFAAAGVDIDLAEVSARLDSDCLWQSRLCFDRLAIRSLRVAVLAAGDDAPDENAEDAFFRQPFGIRAPQLEIGGTEVTWPGGSLRSGELSAGVAFRDDVIRVRRLAVPELILDLGEFDGPAATARLALPRLFLPLDLELVQGRLMRGEVRAAGQTVHLDGLALSVGWRGQRLRLTELS